jgi:hypothetical protein
MQRSILAALFFLFFVSTAYSSERGAASIEVQVQDELGAMVPGATVTLYTRDDRLRISAVTDDAGSYLFDQREALAWIRAVMRK